MIPTTFIHKITSLYVAYAPQFDVSAWGTCQDEALNNLTDQLREQHGEGSQQTREGSSNADR